MMSLLYDLTATQPNTSGKRHGGGRYGEVVFFRMIERKTVNFSCFYDSSQWINPKIMELCLQNNILLFDVCKKDIEQIVYESKCTLLYSPLIINFHFIKNIPFCKTLETYHGLRELELPVDNFILYYRVSLKEITHFFLRKIFPKRYLDWKIKKTEKRFKYPNYSFITVSNHSKYSFFSYYPHFTHKAIKIFYSPPTSEMNHHIQKSPYEKYFLLVSGNRWEKNNLRALIALDNLFSNQLIDDTFKVKITGSSGNDYRYKLKNKEKFEFLGYVDDDVLSNLYANAYCFIYPSLNEGFGYPPLEAMNYSVPVLASPFSAIPECCGDAVIYFNPFSIKEIENRILMILDENIHALYAQRAIERFHIIYEKQRKDLDALIDYIFEETKE